MQKIETFTKDNSRFMSNFFPFKKDGSRFTYMEGEKEIPFCLAIWFEDECYSCTELAYMAAKTTDLRLRSKISKMSPYEAKAYWQERANEVRADFDEIKIGVMTEINRQKFSHPRLKQMLQETGNAILEEGNTWGDTFWGICDGVGENNLGKILMQIRDGLPVDCLYQKDGEFIVSNQRVEGADYVGIIPYAQNRVVMRQAPQKMSHAEALATIKEENKNSKLEWRLIDCSFAMNFFSDKVSAINETLKAIGEPPITDLSFAGYGSDYAFSYFILDDPRELEGKKTLFTIASF